MTSSADREPGTRQRPGRKTSPNVVILSAPMASQPLGGRMQTSRFFHSYCCLLLLYIANLSISNSGDSRT